MGDSREYGDSGEFVDLGECGDSHEYGDSRDSVYFGHYGVSCESGGFMLCSSGRNKYIRVDFVGFHLIILTQANSSAVCA